MAVHGKATNVWWNSLDLSTYLDNVDYSLETDTADATTFGDGFKEYEVGQYTANVSCTGKYSPTSDAAIEGQLQVDSGVLTYCPGAGATAGDRARLLSVSGTSFTNSSPVGDIVAFGWDAISQDSVGLGWVLHPLGEDTNTTTGSTYDGSAATTTGWMSNLHVTAVDGGSWVVKLQDSADDSSWSDVSGGAFTAATGATQQRLESASGATLRRYVRYVATRTGGSAGDGITFALAFARTV